MRVLHGDAFQALFTLQQVHPRLRSSLPMAQHLHRPYRSFLALIGALLLLATIHLVLFLHVSCMLLVDHSADSTILQRLSASGLGLSPLGYSLVLLVSSLMMALVWQQLTWLLGLHYLLHHKGFTTDAFFLEVARGNQPPPRVVPFMFQRLHARLCPSRSEAGEANGSLRTRRVSPSPFIPTAGVRAV
mmetsp:Transcript_4001/g.10403  ORF Transcript_4001/g.10403 Transcript_4001/m.10403 type:complete len:188 (-) Transcript_4001:150-713(-)